MLKGKGALITGSTSGIGLGMARALAEQGCNVMINGFGDAAEIERTRAALASEFGVVVAYSPTDVSDSAAVEAMVAVATDTLGSVDILINNAGIQHISTVQEFPVEKWDAVIGINLSSVFYATHAVLPQMLERNWGRIINTASVHGLVASVNKSAYVAAKHGVVGFTKATALETAETGVTCNAICPGWTRTELIEKQIELRAEQLGVSIEEGARNLVEEKQPSKTFATVEQLGALTVFLCSDAAAQMTGVSLPMDGGWTAQ